MVQLPYYHGLADVHGVLAERLPSVITDSLILKC